MVLFSFAFFKLEFPIFGDLDEFSRSVKTQVLPFGLKILPIYTLFNALKILLTLFIAKYIKENL